jgi:transposase
MIDKSKLEILYLEKMMSHQEICENLGCKSRTLSRYIKKYNLSRTKPKKVKPKKPKKKTKSELIDQEYLIDLYFNQKKSLRDVGSILSVSKRTVTKILSKNSLNPRTQREFFDQVGWTEEKNKKLSQKMKGRFGKDCGSWKGGLTSISLLVRGMPEYIQWRKDVFQRDNFSCQICSVRGVRLNADHIKPFSQILREFKIKGTEDARNCKDLWNLDNGRTLCKDCHRKTDTFAARMNKKIKQLGL